MTKMSKTRQILDLSSPTIKTRHERIIGFVQQCNYCCGNGWFWGLDEYHETIKAPCPICEGTGKVRPEITVEWKPIKRD